MPKAKPKKKKSGVPTGNAGEYFVMGELLRRGFDAQLADRNTKGYDLLVGQEGDKALRKVQVKTARKQPWYVKTADFSGPLEGETTIYVLLGKETADKPIRYFIAKNRKLRDHLYRPNGWKQHGFMNIKSLIPYEDRWDLLRRKSRR